MANTPEFDSAHEAATGQRHAEGDSVDAMSSAASINAVPTFKYNLSRPRHPNYGCILVGDEVFYRNSNVNEIYAALGYQEKLKKDGILPDEFLWDRYTRKGAVKSAQCVQAHIATFLHEHSPKFRELHGYAYSLTVGKCFSEYLDRSDQHCLNCSRHPPSCTDNA